MTGTRGKLMDYYTNAQLANLSQHEIERYVERLADAGMDDGPEWDRIYRWMEKRGLL